jgi:hypothetical protein
MTFAVTYQEQFFFSRKKVKHFKEISAKPPKTETEPSWVLGKTIKLMYFRQGNGDIKIGGYLGCPEYQVITRY